MPSTASAKHPGLCPICGERPTERKRDGGNAGYCTPCRRERNRAYYRANREKVIAKARESYSKDKAYEYKLRREFGLSIEQYNETLIRQDHVCAICHDPESWTREGVIRKLAVDHDHATGQVRGLLCASCNVALGCVRDRPEIARGLADYLEEHCARLPV